MTAKLDMEKACPICGAKAQADSYPFCGKRCAQIDLGRWLGGTYAIPSEETDGPDAADPEKD